MTKRFDFFQILSTVLKRFCPLDSKNVFVLVLVHLEPELELFEVWEIMVLQIRAADLDWIVGPGYSLGRVHSGEKP